MALGVAHSLEPPAEELGVVGPKLLPVLADHLEMLNPRGHPRSEAQTIVKPIAIRHAKPDDAPEVARLLHDFNTEFSEPTPEVPILTERAREMLEAGEMTVLLAGEGPAEGLAQLRFRRSVWTGTLDAYLEELYVVPKSRGRGIGRGLLEGAMDTAREEGAAHIDLTTSEADTAALSLYESAGFTNREGTEDGAAMLYYERDLGEIS